jgi:hypothetical protein
MRPVLAGMWRQCETFDGTYNAMDLLDAHQLLNIQDEMRRRET